ncbi:hypothetical protein [Streptomyces graminilatus]|uniref:hypothetical protein n=1 Tax=Streptomyces graminilatus TaxID=1464070 RepID=UPI000B0D3B1A|nr:hypothetical protein [Streptomyces graminilatus]
MSSGPAAGEASAWHPRGRRAPNIPATGSAPISTHPGGRHGDLATRTGALSPAPVRRRDRGPIPDIFRLAPTKAAPVTDLADRLAQMPRLALVLNHNSRTSADLLAKTAEELLAE